MDENEFFVSQRKDPKLALVVPHFEDGRYLCINAPGMKTLKLDKDDESGEIKKIRYFDIIYLYNL